MRTKLFKDHGPLILGIVSSLLLLGLLFWLQYQTAPILQLENRWLIVAGIPLLLAIIVGGYVRRFKGFGMELETRLKRPITATGFQARQTMNLKASEVMERREELGKMSADELRAIPEKERLKYERLSFVMGRKFYSSDAILFYLHKDDLPNLKYLEIQDQSGAFVCLLEKGSVSYANVHEFITSLESGTVMDVFRESAVADGVDHNKNLLEVLLKVRASRFGFLPVLANSRLVGVVENTAVLERIGDEIIAAERG